MFLILDLKWKPNKEARANSTVLKWTW